MARQFDETAFEPLPPSLADLKFDAAVFVQEAYRAGDAGDIAGRETLACAAIDRLNLVHAHLADAKFAHAVTSLNLLGPSQ